MSKILQLVHVTLPKVTVNTRYDPTRGVDCYDLGDIKLTSDGSTEISVEEPSLVRSICQWGNDGN